MQNKRLDTVKFTIVYDNETSRADLTPAWGFSCVVEANKKILFDTGWDGKILLSNMNALGINTGDLDAIVLSHNHWDHIGGLPTVLAEVDDVEVIVPDSFSKNLKQEISRNHKIRVVKEPQQLFENIYSTGEIMGKYQESLIGEQSIAVKTSKGVVIVAGCAHPGVEEIINVSKQFGDIYGIIGGFHGFNKFHILKKLSLIVPTHCSKHKKEIMIKYADKAEMGGVGWTKKI